MKTNAKNWLLVSVILLFFLASVFAIGCAESQHYLAEQNITEKNGVRLVIVESGESCEDSGYFIKNEGVNKANNLTVTAISNAGEKKLADGFFGSLNPNQNVPLSIGYSDYITEESFNVLVESEEGASVEAFFSKKSEINLISIAHLALLILLPLLSLYFYFISKNKNLALISILAWVILLLLFGLSGATL